jgi:hypothetical protein
MEFGAGVTLWISNELSAISSKLPQHRTTD